MRHGDRFDAVPAPDEGHDHLGLERAGTEERDRRDDVLEVALLEAHRKVALTAALELEHPHGVRCGDLCVHAGVIMRQIERFGHRGLAQPLARHAHGVADRRVSAQPQDVHLHEAERLDIVLVVLRDHHAFGSPLERHPRVDGLARDDETAEVRAEVHRRVIEFGRDLHKELVLWREQWMVAAFRVGGEHLGEPMRAHPRQVA